MPLAVLAQEGQEAIHHISIFDTIGYGIFALACFAVLGLVTLSYRNVANRHAAKAEAYAAAHGKTHDAAGTGH